MDRMKFIALINGLKASYPNFKIIETQAAMELWYKMLSDIEYDKLSMAIGEHISTEKYPPSIAEIREKALVNKLIQEDWSSGWQLVLNAVSKYGIYEAREGMEYIKNNNYLAYEVVNNLGFSNICSSENWNIDRANFRMLYETKQLKENKISVLPKSILKKIFQEEKIKIEDQKLKIENKEGSKKEFKKISEEVFEKLINDAKNSIHFGSNEKGKI